MAVPLTGTGQSPGKRTPTWRADLVHLAHDRQRLRVRHQRALAQPLGQAAADLGRLVAVAPADDRLRALDRLAARRSTAPLPPPSTYGVKMACVGWWKSSRTIRPRSVAISARRDDHEVIDAVIVASAPPG